MKRFIVLFGATVIVSMSALPAGVIGFVKPAAREAAAGEDGADRKGTVWVVNRDKGTLAIFDAGTGQLLATREVGAGAHDICISEQAGKAYITAEMDNVVTVVDTDTLEKESIPVGPGPHHIEPSNDGHTIYVSLLSHTAGGSGAQYAVLDTRDHSVTYRTSSPDAGTRSHAITPTLDGETLYIAHDTGNRVTSVNAESGALNFTLLNIPRAEETAASRSGEVLWVSARGGNAVMRVDLTSNPVAVGDPIPVGSQPESMMLTPNEGTLVVSLRGSPASLSFVDTLALAAFPPVRIGPEDTSLGDLAVMTQNGHFVYATYDNNIPGTGGIAVVDVRTRELVDRWQYPTAGRPHGIWYSTKTPRAVANP
jgi:DNA-binding beta-propeller fold protein YncE